MRSTLWGILFLLKYSHSAAPVLGERASLASPQSQEAYPCTHTGTCAVRRLDTSGGATLGGSPTTSSSAPFVRPCHAHGEQRPMVLPGMRPQGEGRGSFLWTMRPGPAIFRSIAILRLAVALEFQWMAGAGIPAVERTDTLGVWPTDGRSRRGSEAKLDAVARAARKWPSGRSAGCQWAYYQRPQGTAAGSTGLADAFVAGDTNRASQLPCRPRLATVVAGTCAESRRFAAWGTRPAGFAEGGGLASPCQEPSQACCCPGSGAATVGASPFRQTRLHEGMGTVCQRHLQNLGSSAGRKEQGVTDVPGRGGTMGAATERIYPANSTLSHGNGGHTGHRRRLHVGPGCAGGPGCPHQRAGQAGGAATSCPGAITSSRGQDLNLLAIGTGCGGVASPCPAQERAGKVAAAPCAAGCQGHQGAEGQGQAWRRRGQARRGVSSGGSAPSLSPVLSLTGSTGQCHPVVDFPTTVSFQHTVKQEWDYTNPWMARLLGQRAHHEAVVSELGLETNLVLDRRQWQSGDDWSSITCKWVPSERKHYGVQATVPVGQGTSAAHTLVRSALRAHTQSQPHCEARGLSFSSVVELFSRGSDFPKLACVTHP